MESEAKAYVKRKECTNSAAYLQLEGTTYDRVVALQTGDTVTITVATTIEVEGKLINVGTKEVKLTLL